MKWNFVWEIFEIFLWFQAEEQPLLRHIYYNKTVTVFILIRHLFSFHRNWCFFNMREHPTNKCVTNDCTATKFYCHNSQKTSHNYFKNLLRSIITGHHLSHRNIIFVSSMWRGHQPDVEKFVLKKKKKNLFVVLSLANQFNPQKRHRASETVIEILWSRILETKVIIWLQHN